MTSHILRLCSLGSLVLLVVAGLACSESSDRGADAVVDAQLSDLASPDGATGDVLLDVAPLETLAEAGETIPDGDDLSSETVASTCPSAVTPYSLELVADETFDLGPYLMHTTETSATVMWRTTEALPGVVHYGEGDSTDLSEGHDDPRLVHEVVIQGLEPGTRYAYTVQSGDTTSAVHHLHSAPAQGSPVRFVAWADSHGVLEPFGALLDAMGAKGPQLLVGVGDHVDDGFDASLWKPHLFDPARAILHEVPFYATMGNHEGNTSIYFELFSYPHQDEADVFAESYYSYTFGNVFFLVINTNYFPCPGGAVDSPQSAYLKEILDSPAAQAATWRIAYGHEPGYTESWTPGTCWNDGNSCVRSWVLPTLAEHGFHAYLAGDAHVYERAEVDGMLQIITGGGGGGLDEWCVDHPETSVVYQHHHFLTIDAGCDTLRVEATDLDGILFDWVEIEAGTGAVIDQGPMDDMPALVISSASPSPP